MSRQDVARLAGVAPDQVHPATADALRRAYADTQSATVVEVATQEPAQYWRVGDRYYLDDPYFAEQPIAIDDLAYDPTLGLCRRDMLA